MATHLNATMLPEGGIETGMRVGHHEGRMPRKQAPISLSLHWRAKMALKSQPNGKTMHPKMARIGSSVGHFNEPVLQNASMHFLEGKMASI